MTAISIEGLTKSYDGKVVIKNMSCRFETGGKYVLTGRSGIGKTTLFNIIKGYEQADAGRVVVQGRVEYLFQDELLFSNLTVRENIKIKNNLTDRKQEDIDSILEILGLKPLKNKKVHLLSGGERQRVEFAQILLGKPDIIILDEPTSRLDSENKKNLIQMILEVFRDQTVVVASHEAQFFERDFNIIKLKEGMVFDV